MVDTTPAFSQTSRAAFDVVSIKPNNTGEPRGAIARMLQLQPGGRFVARNVTLLQLVLLAYRDEIMSAHLSSGPEWSRSDHYDIEATAPPGVVPGSLTGRARAQLLGTDRLATRRQKAPVSFVIIDSAERPTEN